MALQPGFQTTMLEVAARRIAILSGLVLRTVLKDVAMNGAKMGFVEIPFDGIEFELTNTTKGKPL